MPSKNVFGQSRLQRRGTTYYFRVRIPEDLRWVYDGKYEIKASLKTSDKREAARLCNMRSVGIDKEFAEHRARIALSRGQMPMRKISRIDPELLSALKSRWIREVLVNDAERRKHGLNRDEHAELAVQTEDRATHPFSGLALSTEIVDGRSQTTYEVRPQKLLITAL